jgi:hypothetical protein
VFRVMLDVPERLNRVSEVRFLPGAPILVVFRVILDVPASPAEVT